MISLIVMAWLTQINPFKMGILDNISLTINILMSSLSSLWFIKCRLLVWKRPRVSLLDTGPGNRGSAPLSSDTHSPLGDSVSKVGSGGGF